MLVSLEGIYISKLLQSTSEVILVINVYTRNTPRPPYMAILSCNWYCQRWLTTHRLNRQYKLIFCRFSQPRFTNK